MPLRRPNQAPGQPIGWVCEQQNIKLAEAIR
jgi:hypothetical protein